jgi:alkylation response protein AidB-like acyl-CoA dehydrogenase
VESTGLLEPHLPPDLSDESLELLERVDRACREFRPIEDRYYLQRRFNEETVGHFKRYGLLGMPVSREYGGAGADPVTYALALERIGMEGTGVRTLFSGHTSLGQLTIQRWGTEEQKERYLAPSVKGDIILAFALTEPEAGSDPASLRTEFEEEGGYLRVNGTKYLVSNGTIADAIIIFAYPKGSREGMCAIIVDTDTPGLERMRLKEKLGLYTSDTGLLEMRDVRVPRENLLGERGKGLSVAYSALMNGRLSVAAGCVGVIRDCLEECISYSKAHSLFDREVGRHQWVQAHIAAMAVLYESARLLTWRAALLKKKYDQNYADLSLRYEADLLIAKAKYYASNASYEAASRAVSVLGERGGLLSYRSPRHLCDTRVTRIYEGTDEILSLKIASMILGRDYEAYS